MLIYSATTTILHQQHLDRDTLEVYGTNESIFWKFLLPHVPWFCFHTKLVMKKIPGSIWEGYSNWGTGAKGQASSHPDFHHCVPSDSLAWPWKMAHSQTIHTYIEHVGFPIYLYTLVYRRVHYAYKVFGDPIVVWCGSWTHRQPAETATALKHQRSNGATPKIGSSESRDLLKRSCQDRSDVFFFLCMATQAFCLLI